MPRLARFFVFSLLLGGFAGTGCGPGGTNGTGFGEEDDDGGNSNGGASGGSARGGGGGTIMIDNCGNSAINPGENCDDGNKNSGDGCSTQCQKEGNAVCPVPGEVCVPAPVCGDGILSRTEACDEGQMKTEGCSADCTMVTPGWQCRVGGKPCVPLCGDGQLKGSENCDPPGMGCSTTCLTEPGWSCTGSPSVCTASVCGNGVVEAGESCDDGKDATTGKVNGLFTGDAMEAARGCSKTCTKEPACRDATGTHACAAVCGDGNVDMGEACDDGNSVSGDGCSAMCMLEAGFTCTDMAHTDTEPCQLSAATECLRMPVTYRDFDGQNVASGHPDFFFLGSTPAGGTKVTCVPNASGRPNVGMNGTCWDSDATPLCTGIAAAALGANGKPALGTTTSCPCRFTDWDNSGILTGVAGTTTCTSGAASPTRIETMAKVVQSAQTFAQWYTDSALGTKVINYLELGVLGAGGYQFSSSTGRTVYEDLHDIFMGTAIPARAAQSPIFADAPANTLSSGFFPLEGQTGAHAAKMCNLWPYWPAALTTANCIATDGNPVWQQWDPQGSGQMGVAGTGGRIVPVTGVARNFYFTSEVRYLFKYAGNESLQFYGDDDVWVFINGKLVLDLGAPHERLQGLVTLAGGGATYTIQTTNFVMGVPTTVMIGTGMVANLGLEVGRTYEIVVFHADRHPRESNYQLSLSGFSTTKTTCLPRCGDGVRTGGEECDCGDAGSAPPAECTQNNADGVYGGCTGGCKYGPFCGDMNVDMPQEQCDNGPANGAAYGAKGACTAGCLLAPFCGDAIIDPPFEECDKGEGMNGAPGADCDGMCQRIIL